MPATYTDRLAGLTTSVAVKAPCRVATTANITLSGEQTIDGVAVVADDRVLVKDQTTASQNGIYTVSTTSWARALDFDGERDCVKGTTVKIVEGTISASNWYNVTSNNPITIGTSDITWAQTYVSLTPIPSATTSVEGISELLTIAELRTGTDTTRTATADAIASLWQQGSDIASAATLVKPSDANLGGYHVVTGTTGISALWSSEPAGTEIELRFAGACVLTHHATSFILPGGVNLTTVAGDVARFRCEGSDNWRCVSGPVGWFGGILTAGYVLTANGAGAAPTFQALSSSSGADTGDIKDTISSTEPSGWLFLNGLTIGNGSSGGTGRANADTGALFTVLWNSLADAQAPVSGGRGASAAADFAANKTITLPDARGRTRVGKDDMGGAAAGRMTSGGSGLDGTILGDVGGSQTHALTSAQNGPHTHTGGASGTFNDGASTSKAGGTSANTGSSGSGAAHNNTQPSFIVNTIIKL